MEDSVDTPTSKWESPAFGSQNFLQGVSQDVWFHARSCEEVGEEEDSALMVKRTLSALHVVDIHTFAS